MRKVIYIVSRVHHSLGFEMVAEGLTEIELRFILLNNDDTPLEDYLRRKGVPIKRLKVNSRLNLMKAFFGILIYLIKYRADVVHCHNRFAYLIGIPAAWLLRIKNRIYTRHHSTLQHQFYPSKVKYDKLINSMSTEIIAISENVREVLVDIEKVNSKKIKMVRHGFYLDKFSHVSTERIDNVKLTHDIIGSPVIGVISRFINWKGVEYIVEAFKKIRDDYPNSILLLANSSGPYESKILEHLKKLPNNSYRLIQFEKDIIALYKLMDVFVHVPIDSKIEAFGQIYVEALAVGVPSVFTISGIASEFIKHEFNALVVDYKNEDQIAQAINRILKNQELRQNLITNGIKSAQQFTKECHLKSLERVYNG